MAIEHKEHNPNIGLSIEVQDSLRSYRCNCHAGETNMRGKSACERKEYIYLFCLTELNTICCVWRRAAVIVAMTGRQL